jgi:hypothetical protein
MVIKIEKKLSKTCKEYVGLWFENWLVTIDRRAIYKLVSKEDVKRLKVGEYIEFVVGESTDELPL